MTFENRVLTLIGENYDFDNDLLTPDVAQRVIDIITSMPENKRTTEKQLAHYEGWCGEEYTYVDLKINTVTGHGFHAFVGSENLMVENDEDIAAYKAAFGADVNSEPRI